VNEKRTDFFLVEKTLMQQSQLCSLLLFASDTYYKMTMCIFAVFELDRLSVLAFGEIANPNSFKCQSFLFKPSDWKMSNSDSDALHARSNKVIDGLLHCSL